MEATDVDKSPEGKDPKDQKSDEKSDAALVKSEGADKGSGKGAERKFNFASSEQKLRTSRKWFFFSCL